MFLRAVAEAPKVECHTVSRVDWKVLGQVSWRRLGGASLRRLAAQGREETPEDQDHGDEGRQQRSHQDDENKHVQRRTGGLKSARSNDGTHYECESEGVGRKDEGPSNEGSRRPRQNQVMSDRCDGDVQGTRGNKRGMGDPPGSLNFGPRMRGDRVGEREANEHAEDDQQDTVKRDLKSGSARHLVLPCAAQRIWPSAAGHRPPMVAEAPEVGARHYHGFGTSWFLSCRTSLDDR